jgi:hypothetical protein
MTSNERQFGFACRTKLAGRARYRGRHVEHDRPRLDTRLQPAQEVDDDGDGQSRLDRVRRANARGGSLLLVTLIVLDSVTGGAASAVAQGDAEPIRLAYHATEGCPDEAGFVTRVRARTARARLAWAGESARTFTVVVEAGPTPSGHVTVEGGDRTEGTRRVQADSCSDVADALALVVALAIDPRSSAPQAPPPPPAPTSSSPQATEQRSGGGSLSAGADFVVATGVAPNLPVAGSPYLGWRATGETLFEPSLRLALLRAGSGMFAVATATGKAAFTWTVGRVDVCPIVWPRGVVRVIECARFEAGALDTMGTWDVAMTKTTTRPWLAAGPVARAEWSFLRWAFIDAEVGILVRLLEDRFYFKPDNTTVYQVPPIGVTGGAGVGVHFF